VLKVFSKYFRQSVVFSVRPQVGVKPTQLIGCASAEGVAQHRFLWIKHSELLQHFLRFTQRGGLIQDDVTANVASDGCDKLHDSLMRDTDRVFLDASSEDIGCNILFLRKPVIEAVDQYVCVNESGHAYKDPLCASLYYADASSVAAPATGVSAPWLDRRNGVSTRDLQLRTVFRAEQP